MSINDGGLFGKIKNALKGKAGDVNGSAFPKGTIFRYSDVDGEVGISIVPPSGEEILVTHDMIKCATVLAMGVIDVSASISTSSTRSTGPSITYGTKYLMVLNDGRQAVITVGLGEQQFAIERILF